MGNYSEAEHCYNAALKLNPKDIDALSGLSVLYAEYMDMYDKALQLAHRMLEINPDFQAKTNIAENLIKVGRYEEGRKYALQVLNETQDTVSQSINRFLISSSYLLENDTTNGAKELAKVLGYYKNLNEDFKVEEEQWSFRGLINVISKSNTNLQTKFLLLTLIDLIHGKIDRNRLSFFHAF
jgi:tetratricopeptide (TPR) repeat protein